MTGDRSFRGIPASPWPAVRRGRGQLHVSIEHHDQRARRPRRPRSPRRKADRKSSDRMRSCETGRSRCPTDPTASSTRAGPGDRSARVRRDARSHLDRAARRAAAAAGRQAVDAVRHAHPVARQRHRQRRRPERDVRAGREARMGAPLSPRRSSSSIATASWSQWWPHHDKLFDDDRAGAGRTRSR